MMISREIIINGMPQRIDYELSGIELEHSFNQQQSINDSNAVVRQLKELKYEDIDGIPEDVIDDLASQFRERINNLEYGIMLEVIRKNEECLKPYKTKWKVFSCEVTQTKTHIYTIRAKSAEDAENILSAWYDSHESEVDYDFESEEVNDTDFGYMEEEEGWEDPDNADITIEEE